VLSTRAQLEQAIEDAIWLLPPQVAGAPFTFQNPLRALEDRDFDTAVMTAASALEVQPFLTEAEYHEALEKGHFRSTDLDGVLAEEPNTDVIAGIHDRHSLRRSLALHPPRAFDARSIQWLREESDLLSRFRPDSALAGRNDSAEVGALYEAILKKSHQRSRPPDAHERPRDAILAATGLDLDVVVRPFFVRVLRLFTGLGQKAPMANCEHGLFSAVRVWMATEGKGVLPPELQPLTALLESETARKNDAVAFVSDCLNALGVQPPDCSGYIICKLLMLRGWAALFAWLQRPSVAQSVTPAPRYRLADFLAVQLALTVASVEGQLANPRGWQFLTRSEADSKSVHLVEAFRLFDACQILGLSASEIGSISDVEFDRLRAEIDSFPEIDRRRILHLAYERGLERQLFEQVAATVPIIKAPHKPSLAYVVFCADDKQTVVRQLIEEQWPGIQTDGVPSFLGPQAKDPASADLETRIDAVARLMALTGLDENWPRLIVFAGHGEVAAKSVPDWRSYCGVCRGNCNVSNARHLADWANDPAVRRGLQLRGLSVPMESWFVAVQAHLGPHGGVEVVGREGIPDIHLERLVRVETMLQNTITGQDPSGWRAESNSFLRTLMSPIRRRLSAWFPAPNARASVARGHPGCNLCLVGFSTVPKELLGDNGAFVASYEPERDPNGRTLAGLLGELIPACGKVNLNYFFARTDIEHFGLGNEQSNEDGELKHADSDLCAGLPWKEVSGHIPIRLTIIVAGTLERVTSAMDHCPQAAVLVERGWVHLAVHDGKDVVRHLSTATGTLEVVGRTVTKKRC